MSEVTTLVKDSVATLAVSEGFVYYLTNCCGASAKGSGNGVVCRKCYRYVSSQLGAGWMANDTASWNRWSQQEILYFSKQAGSVKAGMAWANLLKELNDEIRDYAQSLA